ncbi:Multidrug resistance efflux pump [Cohaesibacter marisflavi]|uniref:Multidrug resistance efflux pump n=1 Tax=Cohaesibacter marisflavi TaxID=655353 RepID=A0A1I5LLK4_9HYPH|nr:HlyD family secretion protein [Cohaesibacter marisflavi]SFO98053.1 Multidrug resistance efflux pump [Cohaesibacter marisflavi]
MPKFLRTIATYVAIALGLCGIFVVLYVWGLPPFNATNLQRTEDAYIKGRVTTISPQLAGYIVAVPVQDYQHVTKGQTLIRIDDRIYVQQLAQAKAALQEAEVTLQNADSNEETAKAQVDQAKAQLASTKAALEIARLNLNRTSKLHEKGFAATSQADQYRATFNQAQASLDAQKAALIVAQQHVRTTHINRDALTAAVASAKAQVELAEINLEHTRITAPRDGVLGTVGVHVGQYVTAGTAATHLVPKEVWVVANYKETQLAKMRIGQPVSFTVDAQNDRRFTGHVERFSPATGSEFSVLKSDNATGNFTKVAQRVPVRISIDSNQENSNRLVPGMSVITIVDISVQTDEDSAKGVGGLSLPDAKIFRTALARR